MDKLDLTQPLEAVHRDTGAVALVSRKQPTDHNALFVTPTLDGGWFCFQFDGSHLFDVCPWFIRNANLTAKPSTPSNEELTQRMEKLVRQVASIPEWACSMTRVDLAIAEAQAIVSDLPKPVDPIDPDLRHAREVVLRHITEDEVSDEYKAKVHSGAYDDWPTVVAARAGIKLGRTLAAGGTAHE